MARRLHGHSFQVMLLSLMFMLFTFSRPSSQNCIEIIIQCFLSTTAVSIVFFFLSLLLMYGKLKNRKIEPLLLEDAISQALRCNFYCHHPQRHQPACRHVCTTRGVMAVDELTQKHCDQLLAMASVRKVFISCLLMLFWRCWKQSLTFL